MKKRRVLALLLALSLAVSTNGMTVFAAEAGDLTAPVVSLVEEGAEDVQDGAEQTDAAEDDADDEQEIDSEDTDKNDETGGDATEDQIGKDGDGANDGEDSDEQSPDAEDVSDETIFENDLPEEKDPEAEETEKLPEMIKNEARMVTFTDDTGMRISYDANASQQYIYEVENGVLLSVKTKEAGQDVSGNTIEVLKPVEFEGEVVLTQPEEAEKQYTSVSADLFKTNTKITYVKLPDGVVGIADDTFKGCTALKGAYLPVTVKSIGTSAFEGCTAMTQIAVPKTVTSIGNNAFKGDTRLYMVYMKDVDYSALTSIGDSAFEGCTALAEFCSDIEFYIPTSLETIGESAFKGCEGIKKLNLDTARLETMGRYAFMDCTGMTDTVICRTLAEIPTSAFEGCTGLASLMFSGEKKMTVGEKAFYGCYSLRQVVLPETVEKVSDFAFGKCTNLNRVVVESSQTEIGENAPFPAGDTNAILNLVGKMYIDSTNKVYSKIYNYYRVLSASQKQKTVFVRTDVNNNDYFKYVVVDNGKECADGKITGGQIWVGTATENHSDKNINTLHDGKGVKSDETKYYVYYKAETNYSLVAGSIRSNGEIVQKDKTGYYLTMPLGGTVITAEFHRNNSSDNIVGQKSDVRVEFSNGEPIPPDGVDYGVELKVGQTTRMFLIDKSGVPISASQIKKIASNKTDVAKVSNTGLITAVGKGTAKINVDLTAGDGNSFSIERTIKVVEADIDSISLVASNYDPEIKIKGDIHGIRTAEVPKTLASDEGLSITLKANAYTEAKEGVAKGLTWKSSDTSVATVKKASTTSADSSNVVEIKKGSEGEATITVTAKVNSKKTVTQKFVVSVQNKAVKLASSSVTVNPNLENCGELEIVSSYGGDLPEQEPKIYKKVGNEYRDSDFRLERKEQQNGNEKSCRYNIILRDKKETQDGSYKLYVCLNDDQQNDSMPLKITVKRSVPAPTVKFNTKKTKINLFYKNGGTDKEGDPITVTTEVTKLGKVKVKEFELCALSDKADDQLFTENFEIVNDPEDREKGIVRIRKKNEYLQYTTGKSPKAVVSGYLKIYYEGYCDEAAKKVKVTMPTVTTAPTYVLDRTSVTYRDRADSQTVILVLKDKKTKQMIANNNVAWHVKSDESVVTAADGDLNNGEIVFAVPSPLRKGEVKISLTNPNEWDRNKNSSDRTLSYTFQVKTTSAEPTVKADRTVTLNRNYPEVKGSFTLVSSQKDTKLQETQSFEPQRSSKNADEYDKLVVTYQNGSGSVEIKEGETVAAGTYKWKCYPDEQGVGKLEKAATLTVKVVDSKPVFKLGKGSLVLNLATAKTAANESKIYGEIAEIPLKITGKPEGYTLDIDVNSEDSEDGTQIECITTNKSGAAANFDWTLQDATVDQEGKVVDGKLSVSIDDAAPPSTGTYSFKLTAKYRNSSGNVVPAKPMTFSVKVIRNNDIKVSFTAKGKLNLVDREGKPTTKNTIIYTPILQNVRGTIEDAWIYNADNDTESEYFEIALNQKDGKLYVTPKKTPVNIATGDNTGNETGSGNTDDNGNANGNSGDQPSAQSDAVQDYEYAALANNKQYRVKIAVKVAGYSGDSRFHDGIVSTAFVIKTAQVLPKVKTDKSTLDVFLSNKQYDATFTVTPQAGAAGIVEEIGFHEKDEVPRDAFDVRCEKQPDGSLKVIVHLKEAVAYKCGSTNKVKMYIKFKGQGTNTSGTLVNMNIRVNK